ncbi:MAG TPA: hypothetical protein VF173_08145 [Thermoanaerobaculia bacterium]|nr:hypothetical protein [Thermoanaerobaculia bacterium]
MTFTSSRAVRKALLLLFALGSMVAASAAAPPALALCTPKQCLFNPPMHWSSVLCKCVCDCPNPDGSCGRCV